MNPMYSQLLEAVLTYEADPANRRRSSGPLADLVRQHHTMHRHAVRTDPGWALQAVADQLAYDAALVRLARARGIAIGANAFDIPDQGRAQLEEAIIALGVSLPSNPAVEPGPGPARS